MEECCGSNAPTRESLESSREMGNHEQRAGLSSAQGQGDGNNEKPLKLLSVVIPARDEESCIGSTVEHLHVELRLRNVPHEIVVVDDGSTDQTWEILQAERGRVPT